MCFIECLDLEVLNSICIIYMLLDRVYLLIVYYGLIKIFNCRILFCRFVIVIS